MGSIAGSEAVLPAYLSSAWCLHIIDQHQYTVLVAAIIASAVVPTLIAQRWFEPSRGPAAVGQEASYAYAQDSAGE